MSNEELKNFYKKYICLIRGSYGDEPKEFLEKPFNLNGYTYATNKHILFRSKGVFGADVVDCPEVDDDRWWKFIKEGKERIPYDFKKVGKLKKKYSCEYCDYDQDSNI